MNAENFGDYLKNPALLYQLSYQELKSLVLQYPFSANLHALLFQKSQIEGHKDLDKNLSTFLKTYRWNKSLFLPIKKVSDIQLLIDW